MTLLEEEEKKQRLSEITLSRQLYGLVVKQNISEETHEIQNCVEKKSLKLYSSQDKKFKDVISTILKNTSKIWSSLNFYADLVILDGLNETTSKISNCPYLILKTYEYFTASKQECS